MLVVSDCRQSLKACTENIDSVSLDLHVTNTGTAGFSGVDISMCEIHSQKDLVVEVPPGHSQRLEEWRHGLRSPL